jgi:hypothetical protein
MAIGARNFQVQYGLAKRFLLCVEQIAGFLFVSRAETVLLAGGSVLAIVNSSAAEQDKL